MIASINKVDRSTMRIFYILIKTIQMNSSVILLKNMTGVLDGLETTFRNLYDE